MIPVLRPTVCLWHKILVYILAGLRNGAVEDSFGMKEGLLSKTPQM